MKSVFETLENRSTTRSFKPDPVPENILAKIISTSLRAPSAGNMQNYSIIVTKDPQRRSTLSSMHFRQSQAKTAPVLLTFCADVARFSRWCALKGSEIELMNSWGLLMATGDAFILAQSLALAAESEELGVSYLGSPLSNISNFIEFFQLPKGVFPVVSIAIGYPNEEASSPVARLPVGSVVHEETYSHASDEEIVEAFETKEESEVDRYKENGAFLDGLQTLAEVYSKVKYPPDNVRAFSKNIEKKLETQGFGGP